jgi:hypothetical protein
MMIDGPTLGMSRALQRAGSMPLLLGFVGLNVS